MDRQDQEQLIQRAIEGDRQAVAEIIETHAKKIYHFFKLGCGLITAEAEDLTQLAMVEFWRSLHTYRHEARLETWLLRICRRVAYKHFQQQKKLRESPQEWASDEAQGDAKDQEQQLIEKQRIRLLLDDLDFELREIVYLFYIEEMSETELAELLDIPVETLRTRLKRARKQLRRRWSKGQETQ